jgi:ureidoglycolate lyase
MRQIKAKVINRENFRLYGTCQDLYDVEEFARNPNAAESGGFYPDLLTLPLASTTLPSVCISKVKKSKPVVTFLEYHQYTAEGYVCLDGDCLIYVGKANKGFAPDQIEAFIVPKGVFVKLNPGVIHGTHYPVNDEWVRVLIILPERTYANDFIANRLKEEEQFEIVV